MSAPIVVRGVSSSDDEQPRRTLRAYCPDHPCPIDLLIVATSEAELLDRLDEHRREVTHRMDHPR